MMKAARYQEVGGMYRFVAAFLVPFPVIAASGIVVFERIGSWRLTFSKCKAA